MIPKNPAAAGGTENRHREERNPRHCEERSDEAIS